MTRPRRTRRSSTGSAGRSRAWPDRVLQDNAGDDLTVNSDGPFEFPTPLTDGAGYSVTIKQSPAGQTCTTANADGTIASASVTNITITCIKPPPPGHDDFARADSGGLGAGWAAMTVGGLAISGDTAVGTSSGYSGDIRMGEDYGSDQYSQITLSSTSSPAGRGSGRRSAASPAVRKPIWRSTSGTRATRSSSSTRAPPSTTTGGPRSGSFRSRHCPPAPR